MEKGRFAPSPSGRMHLGNVFAFWLAWLDAKSVGGEIVLRIEDLDPERCKPAYTQQLVEDLEWLGLDWKEGWSRGGERGPYQQSKRTKLYDAAFEKLQAQGLIYPCWCTRGERLAVSAPHPGEDRGPNICPCRTLTRAQREAKMLTRAPAWKVGVPDQEISFTDLCYGERTVNLYKKSGDFIVRRADGAYGYQLAVSVDDGEMGVTRVVRGADLLDSTPWQILLLTQLGYPIPTYGHVPLLLAPDGRRLSKREFDLDMGAMRQVYTREKLIHILEKLSGISSGSETHSAPNSLWGSLPQRGIMVEFGENMTGNQSK